MATGLTHEGVWGYSSYSQGYKLGEMNTVREFRMLDQWLTPVSVYIHPGNLPVEILW
jgi:hypothetical protein